MLPFSYNSFLQNVLRHFVRGFACALACGIVLTLLLGTGCESLVPGGTTTASSKPPLEVMTVSNAVGVDIFVVRVPYAERSTLQALWRESDDMDIPVMLRRDLLDNGMRVGLQGIGLSPALSRLLNLKPAENVDVTPLGPNEVSLGQFESEPLVRRSFEPLYPGKQSLIFPYTDRLDVVPVFRTEGSRAYGHSYRDALGVLNLTVVPQNDGYVLFRVTPELQYGDMKTEYGFSGGVANRVLSMPTHRFDELSTSVRLLPGQWLLIGPASEAPAGIGKYFFTRRVGDTEQKLIAIRLASVQDDGFSKTSDTPPPVAGTSRGLR